MRSVAGQRPPLPESSSPHRRPCWTARAAGACPSPAAASWASTTSAPPPACRSAPRTSSATRGTSTAPRPGRWPAPSWSGAALWVSGGAGGSGAGRGKGQGQVRRAGRARPWVCSGRAGPAPVLCCSSPLTRVPVGAVKAQRAPWRREWCWRCPIRFPHSRGRKVGGPAVRVPVRGCSRPAVRSPGIPRERGRQPGPGTLRSRPAGPAIPVNKVFALGWEIEHLPAREGPHSFISLPPKLLLSGLRLRELGQGLG